MLPTASRPKRGISASILNKASHILNNMPNNKALEEPGAKDGNVSNCWSCTCLSCPPSVQHAWLGKTHPVELKLACVMPARFLLHVGNSLSGRLQASSQRNVQQGTTFNPTWAAAAAGSPPSAAGRLSHAPCLQANWSDGQASNGELVQLSVNHRRTYSEGELQQMETGMVKRPIGPLPCSLSCVLLNTIRYLVCVADNSISCVLLKLTYMRDL